jgi:hypothetical protein
MVPGGTRAFLELPSGRVLGVALPGEVPPAPVAQVAPAAAAPAVKPKPSPASTGGWVAVPAGKPAHQPKKPAPKPSHRP